MIKRLIAIVFFGVALVYCTLLILGGGWGYKKECPISYCDSSIIFVHRGMHDLPENSMDAFLEARSHGFPGLELDIRITKDSELVVVHDENLKRILNMDTSVGELNSNFITEQPIFNQGEPTKSNILTLDSVLAVFAGKTMLFLDIKVNSIPVAKRLLQLIHKHDAYKTTLVASDDLLLIAYLEMKNPKILTVQEGFNWGRRFQLHLEPVKFKSDFFTGSYLQVDSDYLAFLKRNKLLKRTILFDVTENNFDSAIQMGFKHVIMDKTTKSPKFKNYR